MATTITLPSGWINVCVATDVARESTRGKGRRPEARFVRHNTTLFSCCGVYDFVVTRFGHLDDTRVKGLGDFEVSESLMLEINFIDRCPSAWCRDCLHFEIEKLSRSSGQISISQSCAWGQRFSWRVRVYIFDNSHWRMFRSQTTRPLQTGFVMLSLCVVCEEWKLNHGQSLL